MTHADPLVQADNDNHLVDSRYRRRTNLATLARYRKSIEELKQQRIDGMSEVQVVSEKQFDKIDR